MEFELNEISTACYMLLLQHTVSNQAIFGLKLTLPSIALNEASNAVVELCFNVVLTMNSFSPTHSTSCTFPREKNDSRSNTLYINIFRRNVCENWFCFQNCVKAISSESGQKRNTYYMHRWGRIESFPSSELFDS